MNEWKLINVDKLNMGKTYRMEVPGGWIYRYMTSRIDSSVSLVFIPRPIGYKDSDDDPGWKDIDSAPKDGSYILIWYDYPGFNIVICKWNNYTCKWEFQFDFDFPIHDCHIKGWMKLPIKYKSKTQNGDYENE